MKGICLFSVMDLLIIYYADRAYFSLEVLK